MAKKSSIAKQKHKERLSKNKWERRQELKKKIIDPSISHEERIEAINSLNKLPKNSSPIRLRNRCNMTGRCRGYLRKFQLSRLAFRECASHGLIPGVVKASW